MANPITSGIENILGIDTTAGTDQINQAIAALQAVGVPNAAQLTLPQLQQYVSAGVLSPEQYQAISSNPQAYQQAFNANNDTTGLNAQKAALQQLGGIAQNGSTPIMQAQLMNAINTANQSAQANNAAVQENAQERGVAGGGQELLGKLVGNQNAATNANQGALTAGANNATLALQALSNEGTLGGNIQSASDAKAQAAAQAAQQVAEYNSQLQSTANQYNTQNANQAQAANLTNAQNLSNQNTQNANARTEYNAQVPQTIYGDQMQKASGLASEYGNAANLAEQQAQSQNQFTGSLLGAGATLGGDYMLGQGLSAANGASSATPSGMDTSSQYYTQNAAQQNPNMNWAQGGEIPMAKCYAQGGEIHDHEICMKMGGPVPGTPKVPGDSTQNDTVPARLSPHEIVVPNSVTQRPDAPQAAAKFVAGVKGQQTPQMPQGNGKSFADIIKELEANGLELRLTSGS